MWFIALLPLWWVFTAPGRYILWRNYTFPGHGVGPWYSKRQYDDKIVLVLYSAQFWAFWLTAAFITSGLALLALKAVTYGPGGLDLSPFWTVWYTRLNNSWIANLSFDTIVYVGRVIHHWNNEFMGTAPTPTPTWSWHPQPVLPQPAPLAPVNLNSVLNNN